VGSKENENPFGCSLNPMDQGGCWGRETLGGGGRGGVLRLMLEIFKCRPGAQKNNRKGEEKQTTKTLYTLGKEPKKKSYRVGGTLWGFKIGGESPVSGRGWFFLKKKDGTREKVCLFLKGPRGKWLRAASPALGDGKEKKKKTQNTLPPGIAGGEVQQGGKIPRVTRPENGTHTVKKVNGNP